jgi:hypothetical protein
LQNTEQSHCSISGTVSIPIFFVTAEVSCSNLHHSFKDPRFT